MYPTAGTIVAAMSSAASSTVAAILILFVLPFMSFSSFMVVYSVFPGIYVITPLIGARAR